MRGRVGAALAVAAVSYVLLRWLCNNPGVPHPAGTMGTESNWTGLWNVLVVPLANLAISESANTSVSALPCQAAPTKTDSVCYVCPSNWYADCTGDMAKSKGETWRWIDQDTFSCGFLSLGCNAICANLTGLPTFTGTFNSMSFGCCVAKGHTESKRESCTENQGDWAWLGSAESTSNPDFTAGVDAVAGLFENLTFLNVTDVSSALLPNGSWEVRVRTQNLSASLPHDAIVGHVTGLGCSAVWETSFAESRFSVDAQLLVDCVPDTLSNGSFWNVTTLRLDNFTTYSLVLDAIGDGVCYPTGCYVSLVCETLQALIPTLGDLVFQIIKDSFFNGVVGPAIANALNSVLQKLIEESRGVVPEIPCGASLA